MLNNNSGNKTKYMDIYQDLNYAINNGAYPFKSYLPTERALSEHYGVSRLTIRKAIDKLVDEAKIRRIQGAGNMVLVKTHENKGDIIVLAFSNDHGIKIQQPFMEMLLNSFNDQCKNKGLNLLYVSLKKGDPVDSLLLDKSRVRGVVFVSEISDKFVKLAMDVRIPAVLLFNKRTDVIGINPNNHQGSFAATEYVVEKGAKKVAFISGIPSYYNSRTRLAGYKSALACNGILLDEGLIAEGDWSSESGYIAMSDLLENNAKIDAVVAANDTMALGAMRLLSERGFSVPQDLQVIGFDNITQCEFSTPMLSTVSIDTEFITTLALSLLNAQASDGVKLNEEILVQTRLQLRESTK